jgi:hypothetical protein
MSMAILIYVNIFISGLSPKIPHRTPANGMIARIGKEREVATCAL